MSHLGIIGNDERLFQRSEQNERTKELKTRIARHCGKTAQGAEGTTKRHLVENSYINVLLFFDDVLLLIMSDFYKIIVNVIKYNHNIYCNIILIHLHKSDNT